MNIFISSILAGMWISIGGTVYLSVGKLAGAILFTVGLFSICMNNLWLFTGKVCYVFNNDTRYAQGVSITWFGNLTGTYVTATLLKLTRFGQKLMIEAQTLCEVKLSDDLLSIFILAIFCNLLIYLAVDSAVNASSVGAALTGLFLGVVVFIMCGFEHCVANMYYFSMAGVWSSDTIIALLVMTFGNAVGGAIMPLSEKWRT